MHVQGRAAILSLAGLIDESFKGFGSIPEDAQVLIIDTSGVTRLTSFGVRQWLKAMDVLPSRLTDLYLIGCPTFVVDQLNMVLNFGGRAKVLTVQAPFACPSCEAESTDRMIDIIEHRTELVEGILPEQLCARCEAVLEFDESPESFFAFVSKYGATSLNADAVMILETYGLYHAPDRGEEEKAPKIFKIVQDSVTYFKISGVLGGLFRARALAIGAEGEVVIDLGEVTRFTAGGQREWERLIRGLSTQVQSITLVDLGEAMLQAAASGEFRITDQFAIWSLLARYSCGSCGHQALDVLPLAGQTPEIAQMGVCRSCGGASRTELAPQVLERLLASPARPVPAASARFIGNRSEIVSRLVAEASMAQQAEPGAASAAGDTILGKYRIVKLLSSGKMAEVFLAKQVGIGGFEKPVALKRIQRTYLEHRRMSVDPFLADARIAARFVHPNIVQVLDVGEDGGSLYLAMEYVHGCDLRTVMRALKQAGDARPPLADALYIVREVAGALHYAYFSADLEGKTHEGVHRDVSPHNILLGFEGAVKLSDFGMAVSASMGDRDKLVAGKWSYMSPEQTLGQKLDHRSDLFSLGIVLYQLLAGTHPFGADTVQGLVARLRRGEHQPLSRRRPDLPQPLTWLVERMLSVNPDERPPYGQAVVSGLNEVARGLGLELRDEGVANLLAGLFADASQVRPSMPPEHGHLAEKAAAPPQSDPVYPPAPSLQAAPPAERAKPAARRTLILLAILIATAVVVLLYLSLAPVLGAAAR